MKRFLTFLMAAILVAMTAITINVPEAAAAPTATECQELLSFHPFLKDDPYFMEACSSSETENTIKTQCQEELSRYPFLKEDPYFLKDCGSYINTIETENIIKTQCQEDISYDPSLKEDPYFLEECGLYINTAVQIVDIELVNYCTDELEHYPETKEDPYFKKECSDALKSADACREYLFNGSKSILEQLDPKVAPYQFDNYCYVLDNFGILKPDLSSNVEPKSSVASTPTKSVSSAPLNFTREQGETCPAGKTLATVSEARANKSEICNNVLQTWDIARLAGGAAMDGRGYGCEIRDQDKRGMGNAVCK
ncbi:MAG: hypothetical protein F6J86_24835 [Symploca sp. SIO1B1]|nr:hypothetical protein [Symploca sp. SIO1B1]